MDFLNGRYFQALGTNRIKAGTNVPYMCKNSTPTNKNGLIRCKGKLSFRAKVDAKLTGITDHLVSFIPHNKNCKYFDTNSALESLVIQHEKKFRQFKESKDKKSDKQSMELNNNFKILVKCLNDLNDGLECLIKSQKNEEINLNDEANLNNEMDVNDLNDLNDVTNSTDVNDVTDVTNVTNVTNLTDVNNANDENDEKNVNDQMNSNDEKSSSDQMDVNDEASLIDQMSLSDEKNLNDQKNLNDDQNPKISLNDLPNTKLASSSDEKIESSKSDSYYDEDCIVID